MKTLFAIVFFLTALLPASSHAQDMNAEEKEWLSALTYIINDAQAAGIKTNVIVLKDPLPDQSPIYVGYNEAKRECNFVVATRGNTMTRLLTVSAQTDTERFVHMVALWAHEYNHCLAYLAGDARTATDEGLKPGHTHVVSSRENEAMADLFAIAWVLKLSPNDFDSVRKLFTNLRTKLVSDQKAIYNVADYLDRAPRLVQLMAGTALTPYQAAKQLVFGEAVVAQAHVH